VHEVKGSEEERNLWLKSISKRKVTISLKKRLGLGFRKDVIGKSERVMRNLKADTPHEEFVAFDEGRVHFKVTMIVGGQVGSAPALPAAAPKLSILRKSLNAISFVKIGNDEAR
jgi:hypothetical protein